MPMRFSVNPTSLLCASIPSRQDCAKYYHSMSALQSLLFAMFQMHLSWYALIRSHPDCCSSSPLRCYRTILLGLIAHIRFVQKLLCWSHAIIIPCMLGMLQAVTIGSTIREELLSGAWPIISVVARLFAFVARGCIFATQKSIFATQKSMVSIRWYSVQSKLYLHYDDVEALFLLLWSDGL